MRRREPAAAKASARTTTQPRSFPKNEQSSSKGASGGLSDRTYLGRLQGAAYPNSDLARLRTSRRPDVKLILPLATLAGALTLLATSWSASLSYL
jgi:hypothetical protein